jgi:cysteine-rich repeat protein
VFVPHAPVSDICTKLLNQCGPYDEYMASGCSSTPQNNTCTGFLEPDSRGNCILKESYTFVSQNILFLTENAYDHTDDDIIILEASIQFPSGGFENEEIDIVSLVSVVLNRCDTDCMIERVRYRLANTLNIPQHYITTSIIPQESPSTIITKHARTLSETGHTGKQCFKIKSKINWSGFQLCMKWSICGGTNYIDPTESVELDKIHYTDDIFGSCLINTRMDWIVEYVISETSNANKGFFVELHDAVTTPMFSVEMDDKCYFETDTNVMENGIFAVKFKTMSDGTKQIYINVPTLYGLCGWGEYTDTEMKNSKLTIHYLEEYRSVHIAKTCEFDVINSQILNYDSEAANFFGITYDTWLKQYDPQITTFGDPFVFLDSDGRPGIQMAIRLTYHHVSSGRLVGPVGTNGAVDGTVSVIDKYSTCSENFFLYSIQPVWTGASTALCNTKEDGTRSCSYIITIRTDTRETDWDFQFCPEGDKENTIRFTIIANNCRDTNNKINSCETTAVQKLYPKRGEQITVAVSGLFSEFTTRLSFGVFALNNVIISDMNALMVASCTQVPYIGELPWIDNLGKDDTLRCVDVRNEHYKDLVERTSTESSGNYVCVYIYNKDYESVSNPSFHTEIQWDSVILTPLSAIDGVPLGSITPAGGSDRTISEESIYVSTRYTDHNISVKWDANRTLPGVDAFCLNEKNFVREYSKAYPNNNIPFKSISFTTEVRWLTTVPTRRLLESKPNSISENIYLSGTNKGCLSSCVHGTCKGQVCECNLGWNGTNCLVNSHECTVSSTCGTGKMCSNLNDHLKCVDDPCYIVECGNGGTCSVVGNTTICLCVGNWGGDHCEIHQEMFSGFDCVHGQLGYGHPHNCSYCQCSVGWTGAACNTSIDGDYNHTDGCTNNCTLLFCGNGVRECDEECDDGNHNNSDNCTNNCTLSECGDGIQQSHEECDDGNGVNTDSCTNTCNRPFCGDGIIQQWEDCDLGPKPEDRLMHMCSPTCHWPDQGGHGALDRCIGIDCGNGLCTGDGYNFSCLCYTGWNGPACLTDIDYCIGANCNMGDCTDGNSSHICHCRDGWEGHNCMENIYDCEDVDCGNGVCADALMSQGCLCDEGWSGSDCKTNTDECIKGTDNCGLDMVCKKIDNHYKCVYEEYDELVVFSIWGTVLVVVCVMACVSVRKKERVCC